MSNLKTLSVAQLLVLSTAAQRPDHVVLPLPPTVRARGSAQRNLLSALLKMQLVEEFSLDDAARAWRTDGSGQNFGLRLTAAGLAAAGVPREEPPPSISEVASEKASASVSSEPAIPETSAVALAVRPPAGKLGEVLRAISAEAGATLSEITTLTGWLPHTARAAVTGLRQRGFAIQLVERDGRKAYLLAAAN